MQPDRREDPAGGASGEEALVAAARAGDPAARAAIVAQNEKRVYNLALRLTRDPGEAEIVLQETFLKAFRGLGRFRGGSSLSTWIHRIATNEALQRLRRRRRQGRGEQAAAFVDLDHLEADPTVDLGYAARALEEDPHVLLENRELRERLERAIGELPPKHRAIFVLVDLEGMTVAAAARANGISLPAAKTNLRRARLFLRDRLAGYLAEEREGNRHGA
ncbi:MAG: RNA polymerase sigma factor [Candidatus Eisenbacteria bacterium]